MLPRPSIDNLVHSVKERYHAPYIHAVICASGLQAHKSLQHHLVSVSTFIEVQSVCVAQKIATELMPISPCALDSLIIGYIRGGEPRYALNLYQKVRELSLPLSPFTFVALLKGCTHLRDLKS
eukprot:c29566_g1_i1 orf=52-420(+)